MKPIKIVLIITSSLIAVGSLIICFIGPMNSGNIMCYSDPYYDKNDYFNSVNCNFYDDLGATRTIPEQKNYYEKVGKTCKRFKAMKGLELAAFLINLFFAIFCIFISFWCDDCLSLNLISFIISLVITVTYVSFNGYIFYNDTPNNLFDYYEIRDNENYPHLESAYLKRDSNGAIAKLNHNTGYYYSLFRKEENSDIFDLFFKFKDLRNKYINYNDEMFKRSKYNSQKGEEIKSCQYSDNYYLINNGLYEGLIPVQTYQDSNGNTLECEYLYKSYNSYYYSSYLRKLYYKWIGTLILGCFIGATDIISLIGICIHWKYG